MALHHPLRAVAEQYGAQLLYDADGLRRALESRPETTHESALDLERVSETARWGGLSRLDEAVHQGMDPGTAIAQVGDAITHERASQDYEGTRWALAALAFAAGRLPESEVARWTPATGAHPAPGYGAQQTQPLWGGPAADQGYQPEDSSSRSKTPLIVAVAAIVVLALIGGGLWWAFSGDDGGYDESAYCEAYREAEGALSGADFMTFDGDQYAELQRQVAELRDLAPPELKDEWEALDGALTELDNILSDAGLTFDDVAGLTEGEVPEGVEVADLVEAGERLQEFSESSELQEAGDTVDQDAEERCK